MIESARATKMAIRWSFRVLLAIGLPTSSTGAVDSTGTGTGVIPDNDANGRVVTFAVSGATRSIEDVSLVLTISHTWVSDLEAVLTSPDGTARLVIFGRAGKRRSGSSGESANLDGTYIFIDDAATDLWGTLAGQSTSFVIPSGVYRTSTQGYSSAAINTNAGGCTTLLRGAFGRLPPAKTNGLWSLRIADREAIDAGSVTAATLKINYFPAAVFSNSFEGNAVTPTLPPPYPQSSGVRGSCTRRNYDFTGTGLASYVTVRNTGGGPNGAVTWFVRSNDATAGGAQTSFVLGTSSNQFISGDFDGDGIDDATIWRSTTPGQFVVRRSSRPTDAPLEISFGQLGDDPTHIGDFDGDGLSDAAVYRQGASTGDPSQTLILLSSTNEVRQLTTGQNGDFPSSGIDYDGDGKADIAMQSNAGGGQAQFRLQSGINGAQFNTFLLGTPTDVIMTGNHVGSAVGDITLLRTVAGVVQWTTRDTISGVTAPAVGFGASATDFPLAGDYDGDGLDDFAVWRPSETVGESKFIIRPSLTPATTLEVFMGENGDYPPASARRH